MLGHPAGREERPKRSGVDEDPEGDQEGGDEHHREHGHERGGRLAEEQPERRWRRQEPGADRNHEVRDPEEVEGDGQGPRPGAAGQVGGGHGQGRDADQDVTPARRPGEDGR